MMVIKLETSAQMDVFNEALKLADLKEITPLDKESSRVLQQALCLYRDKCALNISALSTRNGSLMLTRFFEKRIRITNHLIKTLSI